MNNLLLRIQTAKLSFKNLIIDNINLINTTPQFVYTGMNILNIRDIDLWKVLQSMSNVTTPQQSIINDLQMMYDMGLSVQHFIYSGGVVQNMPFDMNSGYFISNIKLLKIMGHPSLDNINSISFIDESTNTTMSATIINI
jgi:hypothetical protein